MSSAIFVRRWHAVVDRILGGLISTLYYFRVAPLGVTAKLGSIVRTAGTNLGVLPSMKFGLDTLRGCVSVIEEALRSGNSLFVV